MTSHTRHAPRSGKQGGVQPGGNQYRSFYLLVRVFFFWGGGVRSLWIHRLLPQRRVSCWSPLTHCGQIQKEADGSEEGVGWRWRARGRCYDWTKSCSTAQLSHEHQHLFWVQLPGGPRRAIFQVWTDLRSRQPRYFTHGLKLDVDFAIEGAVNHRHKGHRLQGIAPWKAALSSTRPFFQEQAEFCHL